MRLRGGWFAGKCVRGGFGSRSRRRLRRRSAGARHQARAALRRLDTVRFVFGGKLVLAHAVGLKPCAPRGRRSSAGQLFAVLIRRVRGHGNRPCGDSSILRTLRTKAAKSRPTRSGSPPRSEGRSHLSGEGRQRERKLNSPHAQPSPYQAAKSRPVRSGPPPRSAGRSPTA